MLEEIWPCISKSLKASVLSMVIPVLRNDPGGSVVKNSLSNAGDMGLIPGSRKIPHAKVQLSLCATTTKPTCSEACKTQLESVHCSEDPPLPQLRPNEDK